MQHRLFLFSRRFQYFSSLALCLALILGGMGVAGAQSSSLGGDALAPFEQTMFSHDYIGEPMSARLDRLENSVFGGTQSGSDSERQARLVKALSAAKEVIPNATADKNTDNQPPDANSPGITRYTPPGSVSADAPQAISGGSDAGSAYGTSGVQNPKPAGDSDYPTVTALEREVFGRDFVREDVTHRLDRLEKRAFGQPSPQMALSDRVDRLMALYPNAAADVARYSREASGGSSVMSPAVRALPDDSSQFAGSTDTYTKVSMLEKKFFNGKTYSGEMLTQRLNRLENKAYGRIYTGQGIDMRVNRLLGAYRVGGSKNQSAYSRPILTQPDPAKWQSPETVGYTGSFLSSQRMGTSYGTSGMTSGGQSYVSPSNSPPQNVQIGAGFNSRSTSSTSLGYSPEMMSMLPPGMQQQQPSYGSSSSSTIVGAPGTVITQQSTTYPGFQVYGGQPFQTYSYYGNPAVQSQTQSTTTVIQPNGSQMTSPTMVTTQTGVLPGTINGLPTPAYTGDPAVLQALGNLEINLFGAVDVMNPVPVRLTRLETTMLHQVYPALPDAQRVANLQRAYQLQSVGRVMGNSTAANMARTAGSMLFGVPLTPGGTAVPGVTNPYIGMPYTGMPTGLPNQVITPLK